MAVEIVVALIGAIGVVGAAGVTALSQVRLARRIGEPNGKGNVVEMLEHLLEGQERQDLLLEQHGKRLDSIETQLSDFPSSGG